MKIKAILAAVLCCMPSLALAKIRIVTTTEDFAALDPTLIDGLHAAGVRLVGIDTPSVDLFASKDLPTHGACLRHDIRILEGLVLSEVPAGVYELIALPLRLEGFDASPVRAVLRSL